MNDSVSVLLPEIRSVRTEITAVRSEIASLRNEVRENIRDVNSQIDAQKHCNLRMKLAHKELEGKVNTSCKDIGTLVEGFNHHIKDSTRHYNPHYTETIPERIARKKLEIGIATGGGGLIGLLIWLLERIRL